MKERERERERGEDKTPLSTVSLTHLLGSNCAYRFALVQVCYESRNNGTLGREQGIMCMTSKLTTFLARLGHTTDEIS